jgi:AcrR family transcriptional regulator
VAAKARKKKKGEEPDRRERLLNAARELFFTRGYAATRVEDVSSAAGFSKRVVYLEFPSKGALFAAICEEGILMLRDALAPVLDEKRHPLDELREIATRYLRFAQQRRGHYRMLFLWATDDVLNDALPAQRKRLKEIETECVNVLARSIERAAQENVLRADLDTWKTAMLVWASLNGVLIVREMTQRSEMAGTSPSDLYWRTIDLFLLGAGSVEGLKRA